MPWWDYNVPKILPGPADQDELSVLYSSYRIECRGGRNFHLPATDA